MKSGCVSVANHSLHCEAKAKSGDLLWPPDFISKMGGQELLPQPSE